MRDVSRPPMGCSDHFIVQSPSPRAECVFNGLCTHILLAAAMKYAPTDGLTTNDGVVRIALHFQRFQNGKGI